MSVLDYIDSDIFTVSYDNKIPLIKSQSIENICKELSYAIKFGEKIFIYGDYDMDGFCCVMLWKEVLSSLYNVTPDVFSYVSKTHSLDGNIIEQVKESNARVVLICDTGSSQEDREIISLLKVISKSPIVIDHHTWDGNYLVDRNNYLVFNSFEERSCFDNATISGAYASLIVANVLCTKYFNRSLPHNAIVYTLSSLYSDIVDLTPPINRVVYNAVSLLKMEGPNLFKALNQFNYRYSKRFFSFIVSPKINACFRSENLMVLNRILKTDNRVISSNLVEPIIDIYKENKNLTKTFVPLFQREIIGDILLCIYDNEEDIMVNHIRNYTGLIANSIASESKSIVIVVVHTKAGYFGSYRDYFNREALNDFKLFCDAKGHPPAFGLNFTDLTEFKRHLKIIGDVLNSKGKKDYNVLSSSLIKTTDDVDILALYNEYMNVQPKVVLTHRCRYLRQLYATQFKIVYDMGLPYSVTSDRILREGSNILIEPMITSTVELRCVN